MSISAKEGFTEGRERVTSFTAGRFRQVLSRWPTGVSIVSSITGDGSALGLVIGSFGSISLDPPLVAFSVTRNSSSLAAIRETRRFCVNVLSDEQAHLVEVFSRGDPKARFAGIPYSLSPGGMPIVEGTLAWIDAEVEHEYGGGDHIIVLGRVQALSEGKPGTPLVFAQGTLGTFGMM